LGFQDEPDAKLPGIDAAPGDWERRRQITLDNAAAFLERHAERGCSFIPVGAAQGWSPGTYADSVAQLQRIGYQRIALGGMVPLKTQQILSALRQIAEVRSPETELHLLGVTRVEHIESFEDFGITSFDSTSPFRQAFKDERDNYYTSDGAAHTAVRVPQVEGNAKLKMRIRAGQIDPVRASQLERGCLAALEAFGAGTATLDETVESLRLYESLWDGKTDRSRLYRETLAARPWETCRCGVCGSAGINVVMFRGSERNKRRGFHNLYVFGLQLQRHLRGVVSPD
jgi:hypothetical protein